MKVKVWITKAIDRACDAAVRLVDLGMVPVIVPIMSVSYFDPPVQYADYDGIVIASSRSAIALQLTPCFADLAGILHSKIKVISVGNIDTDRLKIWRSFPDFQSMMEDHPNWEHMNLLYVRGTRKDVHVSKLLGCKEAVLYRLSPIALKPHQLLEISMTKYVLVYWRPAAAKIVHSLRYVPALFEKITPICINNKVAQVLRGAPWRNLVVADEPTELSMLQKLSSLLQ